MRGRLRWLGLAALMLIAAAGAMFMWRTPEALVPMDSAALGLLLQERDGGVYILAVSDSSAAEVAGLEPGDRILRAGDACVTEASQLSTMLEGGVKSLQLTVRRQERELHLTLPCR